MGDRIRLSKFLARLLRHDARSCGLEVTAEGYVNVDDILRLSQISGYTRNDVEEVVRYDNKGRFKIRTFNNKRQIMATQGHSMKLDDPDLRPIRNHTDVRNVLHGTRSRNWPSIKSQGLSRKNRMHVHFAEAETNVQSGFPPYCDMAIEINLEMALRDGLEFYKSDNGVILSPGDADGFIPSRYFRKAYYIRTKENIPL